MLILTVLRQCPGDNRTVFGCVCMFPDIIRSRGPRVNQWFNTVDLLKLEQMAGQWWEEVGPWGVFLGPFPWSSRPLTGALLL